ncbi:MAG: hypothetical protein RMJ98_13925 [Myxococcales bacterium]|nr:hypothetical protein [Polyangiaceae bacterium]MDW8250389.1 hypothetical protein [Myxococcales bacterium]
MLTAEEITEFQKLVARIALALEQTPHHNELRYAYRLAASYALSLQDQLTEIARLQGNQVVCSPLSMAS